MSIASVVSKVMHFLRSGRNSHAPKKERSPGESSATLPHAKNEAAIRLLQGWLDDESGYDERAWPLVKEAMAANRLSARNPCDD